jgi:hypothetical protein
MKKIIYTCVILFTIFTKINAQFIGYYSLRDGGVDLPNSTLFVLPDHTFVLLYVGGNPLQGNWIEESKDKIKLEINTADKSIFDVYAIAGNETRNNIQFSPLEKVNLYVCFSTDSSKKSIYQPLFDENWNCLDRNFETKIPNKTTQIKLVSPDLGSDFSEDTKYPAISKVYTFQLSEKFSSYRVFIDSNLKIPMKFEIKKQDDDYIVSQTKGFKPCSTDRNDLSDDVLKKMKEALIPWQISTLIRKGINIEKLKPIKVEKIELEKPLEKPLFIAKCE